jgi:hypothetical protein
VTALTLHGPQRRALGQRRGDAVAGAAAVMAIRAAGADAFALSLRVPRVVRQGLTASPVAIFATMIARASSSAGRFSPLGPVGTGPL